MRLAKQHGVKVGAHPSLPDLQGFGRREMKMRPEELTNCIVYQVGALKGFLERRRHDARSTSSRTARSMAWPRIRRWRRRSPTPPRCSTCRCWAWPARCTRRSITAAGWNSSPSIYADLDYADDGTLIITREHHAVDPKRAAEGALRAVKEGVARSVNGNNIHVRADCICVHSDTPNAVEVAQAVKAAVADISWIAALAFEGGSRMAQHEVLIRCREFSTGGRRRKAALQAGRRRVAEGDIIGLVEVMKQFTEVQADAAARSCVS